ncbi:DUF2796 domain-containing protein [Pseudomonas sp. SST3]|uniref:DUF2796 domain-containing protein n=1 Tax=Pseudomonas sp. SST3 TaxID=2267882 RepID=UPI000DFE72B2|nr:DUF2796 domain-containing protein [Pseudomonas sp. SST3]NKQ10200.1 DUF2796 domain-containing protein [Pseudomonas sp. SST3]
MHHLLLALPFALLPGFVLAAETHDHDHHHAQHGSLGAHEHGAAELDVALDSSTLEIEMRSPAMNLVGFEHAPNSEADDRKIADARKRLEQPDTLFGLSAAAGCVLAETDLQSPLFEDDVPEHEHEEGHDQDHSEIHARYRFDCATPQALTGVDLQGLFAAFPGTEKVQTQLIGPNGQHGAQLSADQLRAEF